MFDRLREWIRSTRSFRADHEAAWAPVRQPDSDGFSPHLVASERLVVEVLRERGLALTSREVHMGRILDHEPLAAWVTASVPELGAELWLSCDQTEIVAPNYKLILEEWDTRTPQEHLDTVADAIRQLPLV